MLGHKIEAALASGATVAGVICDAKTIAERDLDIWRDRVGEGIAPIPLHAFAPSRVPFYFVDDTNARAAVALMRDLELDLLLNGGVPRILKRPVLRAARLGVANVHPGLIPEYRGCCCIEWAILNGDPVGNTVHLMSEEIDLGTVVLRRAVDLNGTDNFQSVCARVYMEGVSLLAEALRQLSEGSAVLGRPLEPGEGAYYKPVDDTLLEQVKDKLRRGEYAPRIAAA